MKDPHMPGPGGLVVSAIVFYAAMALIGAAIVSAQGLELVTVVFGDGTTGLRDAALGAGTGLAVVGLTWVTRNVPAMRRLSEELSPMVAGLDSAQIALMAVTSAIGEELMFRGGLQPLIGFWPTVIVFGLAHGGLNRRLALWVVFAALAGILLGWLTVYTGNLLAPVVCHLTVNFWNLHAMASESTPTPPAEP
ncbi:MAG: CPBP family intramembrane metalloprotease [Deltaproteobacteria bacterium]|nr:MAG: CPBP family intramembrane metalloprotease [Deltaproteobacteria bacterium]